MKSVKQLETIMKSEEIAIRFVDIQEAAILAALGRETLYDAFAGHPLMPTADLNLYLDKAFAIEQITGELLNPKSIFLLAEIGGEAAGYAKLVMDARVQGVTAEKPIKLQRLYAKQKFLGAGLGPALLRRCLVESMDRGHDCMWLTVWEHNLRAQRFYQKWHFEPCGFIDFPLGNAVMRDVLMQRVVNCL